MPSTFFKLISASVLVPVLCFMAPCAAKGDVTSAEAAKSLPDKIGTFRGRGLASQPAQGVEENYPEKDIVVSQAARTYSSINGNTFIVYLSKTRTDSAAYALLTWSRPPNQEIKFADVGTASFVGPRSAFFFKGNTFVKVLQLPKGPSGDEIVNLARDLAQQLGAVEKEIPVLVKHLPDWEKVQSQATYAISLQALKGIIPNQPVLDAVNFEGGAEAVVGNYDSGRLVIIEFNTPQISSDNDRNIKAKIEEIRSPSQPVGTPVPTAYRRVGNYSVFVFDAPSQEAANQLIDQVQYQPVVQWLGRNPYLYDQAAREFTQTTLGVFIAVVKASGLVIIGSLAFGGLLGALLFRRRRAQQRSVDAYSDAGGMLRLNLDEMTPRTDPARLLGPGH